MTVTTKGCTCPGGPEECRFLALIDFANRVGWPDVDGWMFMGQVVVAGHDWPTETLSTYKHGQTRCYLNLGLRDRLPYVGGYDLRAEGHPFHPYRAVTDDEALEAAGVGRDGRVEEERATEGGTG